MKVVLYAPFRRARNTVYCGVLQFDTGDSLKIEAEATPETVAIVRDRVSSVAQTIAAWAQGHVEFRGNWNGVLGGFAESLLGQVANNPALNVPMPVQARRYLQVKEGERTDPLITDASANDLDTIKKSVEWLKRENFRHSFNKACGSSGRGPEIRRLLGGCYCVGYCCEGCLIHPVMNYDLGVALGQLPVENPADKMALGMCNLFASRSLKHLDIDPGTSE